MGGSGVSASTRVTMAGSEAPDGDLNGDGARLTTLGLQVAMRRSLKALRANGRAAGLSASCKLWSRLPMTAPVPAILNETLLSARGRARPCASTIKTLTIAILTAALMVPRSAVATIFAAVPAVTRFSVRTTPPFLDARASTTPGAYLTFHSTWPFLVIGCVPRLTPWWKNSAESWLAYATTRTSWPSLSRQFQCGSRCSAGSASHRSYSKRAGSLGKPQVSGMP